jgi:hypothetical protein
MLRRFTLIDFAELRCTLRWQKLVVNNHCLFDEFYAEIAAEGNLRTQLKRAMLSMEEFGNGLMLPSTQVKRITRQGDMVNLFEIKTRHLRIYFFRDITGAIVVLGGKKSTQKHDIKRFRNLVVQYFNDKA